MADDISGKDFAQKVVQASGPVLIDFYAPWCGPCKLLTPILAEVEQERAGLAVVKVNVDNDPELAQQHKVMGVPTLILYKGGKSVGSWVGVRTKQILLKEIDVLLAGS